MNDMNDKIIKAYLARAEQIIGKRTPAEIEYDDIIVDGLEKGLSIEEALTNADRAHPSEAIVWNTGNIRDITAHYDYLKEHAQILRKLFKVIPK